MRLLHTDKLIFQEFEADSRPRYAILSHRWADDEVSHRDILDGKAVGTAGYNRTIDACKLAKSRGLDWIWMDTCCVDQSNLEEVESSFALSWSYYAGCAECYVHLWDVPEHEIKLRSDRSVSAKLSQLEPQTFSAMGKSEWFRRGWTLQELLAPAKVLFYAADWSFIGSKQALAPALSSITGVDIPYLIDPSNIKNASIATRMSWLASRTTERVEDLAYCLVGLLEIEMPFVYGEGERAFLRLQEQIIKRHASDETIFACRVDKDAALDVPAPSLLTSVQSDGDLRASTTGKSIELEDLSEINSSTSTVFRALERKTEQYSRDTVQVTGANINCSA